MRAMMQSWEAEYAEFVSARLARLHRQAYLLTGDRHLADDLVQQTCLNLYVHWRKARQADNLAAYVNGTLVKAFLNERRKPWSQRVRVIESPPDLPEVRAGQVEERVLLRQALSRVPRRQRLVLILRFLCDQSVAEVAAALECSPGTVKSQCSHGLAALRRALRELGAEEEWFDARVK
jgi:RNA polymerase sigma-70 factor (sigma-E family)